MRMNVNITPSSETPFFDIEGRFYRSVDANYSADALAGSFAAGRYSSSDQRALYLSASKDGVNAAMQAHILPDSPARIILEFNVCAQQIFDLRDIDACYHYGISQADAAAPWQEDVRKGKIPSSWHVAHRVREIGAFGLIDRSRKVPNLWHLVLFEWNISGRPTISCTH